MDSSLAVGELLADQMMDMVELRLRLVEDILGIVCGEVDFYTSEKVQGQDGRIVNQNLKCNEAQEKLANAVVFLNSDIDTKKEMALEWGHDLSEVAEAFWETASDKTVSKA